LGVSNYATKTRIKPSEALEEGGIGYFLRSTITVEAKEAKPMRHMSDVPAS